VNEAARIELAHAPGFKLGRLTVRPATREIVRDDGEIEILEPRVMQVLVALANAEGAIVSRDDLSHSCWESRVVGDDAINRVISRLRRSAEAIGESDFRIETVTKVGYRLVRDGAAAPDATGVPGSVSARPIARRGLLIGTGVIAGAAAIGTAGWMFSRPSAPSGPPADVAPLLDQARLAFRGFNTEGTMQAIGLLKRVTELHPDYADGWGQLASYYSAAVHGATAEESLRYAAFTRAAIKRALALDPHNAYAHLAEAYMQPRMGTWGEVEHMLRATMAEHPDNDAVGLTLAFMLESVGRIRDATAIHERFFLNRAPEPGPAYLYGRLLWGADRLDEADRWFERAFSLYPRFFAIWFSRFYFLMYTGRPEQALAMGANVDGRPLGIPASEFDHIMLVAQALHTRSAADIDAAMHPNLEAAVQAAGRAENTIQFASALGRVDDAFRVAEAYFFSRGFRVGDMRFSREQGGHTRFEDRRTNFLFLPSTSAMRADPRFDRLIGEIKLKDYWAKAGKPDYQTK
jgi:DNA-binding winged helix-turn-helix (wHTH) protein